MNSIVRALADTLRVPYRLVTRDLEKTSFSSSRICARFERDCRLPKLEFSYDPATDSIGFKGFTTPPYREFIYRLDRELCRGPQQPTQFQIAFECRAEGTYIVPLSRIVAAHA